MRTALKIIGTIVLALIACAIVAAAVLMRPMDAGDLRSNPDPAANYDEAIARAEHLRSAESTMGLQPLGRSLLLTHGSTTTTSVVLFHGFTDVPEQFALVAQGLYDSGANVYVPRAPFHGYADRMTSDPSKMTPSVMRDFADDSIDIARGLGDNVVVAGMSGGGALTMWSAAERPDVAQAVVISPLALPAGYKPWMVRPAARALLALPDRYQWWTDRQQAEPGPEYPRYSLHGIASYLLLAERAAADAGSPAGDPSVVVVANAGDPKLDTGRPVDVMRALVGDERLRVVRIPASAGITHDVVGYWGENRPKLRAAYRALSQAFGVALPDPLSKPEPQSR